MTLRGNHGALILDPFAGAGRFSSGFILIGYDVAGGVEIDKWSHALDAKGAYRKYKGAQEEKAIKLSNLMILCRKETHAGKPCFLYGQS